MNHFFLERLATYPFSLSNASGSLSSLLPHSFPSLYNASGFSLSLCLNIVFSVFWFGFLAWKEMDKETNQESPSLPSNNNSIKEDPSRKRLSATGAGGGGGGDRLKRDEWSEGAVSCLLEAYESKWILRNRAKLKGHDWEDVARYVSSRANCTKSPKTQTQCKNKIESMKKRYRSESATADASSWHLYPRLDLLLRGSSAAAAVAPPPPQQQPPPSLQASNHPPPLILLETSHLLPQLPPQPPLPPAIVTAQNSHGSNGVDRGAKVSEKIPFPVIHFLSNSLLGQKTC